MLKRGGRMMPSTRRALIILPIWITSLLWMWGWWLGSSYTRFWPLFIPLTLALLYEFALLPSSLLYFVFKAKRPQRRIAAKNQKVAVISLCVPAMESLDIVENQLQAMAAITYPHDSWILDEGNSPAIKALAKRYGVKHFSRRGIKAYNQPHPPFQMKTKAGNVNAWLDHVKRRKYDFFVQLDIDHIPKPNYLNKTLGYFRDKRVAWVQASSVYKNMGSWTARGAAEQELVLQGPLQMGFYGHSDTPFIIGSHCTYRMAAVNEIGGFQPTRAEDHLDTLYLAHHGYKGVFLPEIIAEGDGPETLTTYLAQQFAWAYSMFQVLLRHTPKLIGAMPAKRRWQFLFAQTWYPLWSLTYLTMFISPLVAIILNRDVAQVDPWQMLLHFIPLYICGYLVWWSARPLMQPSALRLSWRGVLLHVVRWPIILQAIVAAALKVKKSYMITPKGSYAQMVPSLVTYRPFLLLGLASTGDVTLVSILRAGQIPEAQVIFATINAVFMLTICLTDIGLRFRQSKPDLQTIRQYWLKPLSATLAFALVLGAAITTSSLATTQPQALAAAAPILADIGIPQSVSYSMPTAELINQIKLVPKNSQETPKLGIYNPSLSLAKAQHPYIQHTFVDWRDDHYFALAVASSLQSHNTPLITVEPRGEDDGAKLLGGIADGTYDARLDNLAAVARASHSPIYIRFGHEMELSNVYPWGNQDPELYKAAYRHMVDRMRADGAQNVRFVWSPAGNPNASDYYPGDAYVNVVGTTILYDQYWYGSYVPTFGELASGRQWLQHYNKPVWIVEFGAGGANPSDQSNLIQQAVGQYQQLGFQALVYLNISDANITGPDYRLDSSNTFSPLSSH